MDTFRITNPDGNPYSSDVWVGDEKVTHCLHVSIWVDPHLGLVGAFEVFWVECDVVFEAEGRRYRLVTEQRGGPARFPALYDADTGERVEDWGRVSVQFSRSTIDGMVRASSGLPRPPE